MPMFSYDFDVIPDSFKTAFYNRGRPTLKKSVLMTMALKNLKIVRIHLLKSIPDEFFYYLWAIDCAFGSCV